MVGTRRGRHARGAARRRAALPPRIAAGPDRRRLMSNAIGVVGLGVMGGNLARNIDSRGLRAVGYDLNVAKTKEFLAGPAKGTAIVGVDTPAELARALER